MRRPDETIPLDSCVHGHAYRLRARNFRVGVYDSGEKGFLGVRTKWGSQFLDTEYHYDASEGFGTACPLEDLGPVPEGTEVSRNAQLLEWLKARPETRGP